MSHLHGMLDALDCGAECTHAESPISWLIETDSRADSMGSARVQGLYVVCKHGMGACAYPLVGICLAAQPLFS